MLRIIRIGKILQIIGFFFIIIGSLSCLYSYFFLGGLFISNKFDLCTNRFFDVSVYLGFYFFYIFGQNITFFVIAQLITLALFLTIWRFIRYNFRKIFIYIKVNKRKKSR